jgi:uncharacterized protein (UPF0335 family)
MSDTPGVGHNDAGFADDRLLSIGERIERLETEKKALDIADIYKEAKSAGYDTRIIRDCLRMRKMDGADLQERDALTVIYRRAMGL